MSTTATEMTTSTWEVAIETKIATATLVPKMAIEAAMETLEMTMTNSMETVGGTNYCRTGNFCEHNLCVLVCNIILRKCIFAFLAASV